MHMSFLPILHNRWQYLPPGRKDEYGLLPQRNRAMFLRASGTKRNWENSNPKQSWSYPIKHNFPSLDLERITRRNILGENRLEFSQNSAQRHETSQRASKDHAKWKIQRRDGKILESKVKEENPDALREKIDSLQDNKNRLCINILLAMKTVNKILNEKPLSLKTYT